MMTERQMYDMARGAGLMGCDVGSNKWEQAVFKLCRAVEMQTRAVVAQEWADLSICAEKKAAKGKIIPGRRFWVALAPAPKADWISWGESEARERWPDADKYVDATDYDDDEFEALILRGKVRET